VRLAAVRSRWAQTGLAISPFCLEHLLPMDQATSQAPQIVTPQIVTPRGVRKPHVVIVEGVIVLLAVAFSAFCALLVACMCVSDAVKYCWQHPRRDRVRRGLQAERPLSAEAAPPN
jgi:hypothetical protein